MRLILEQVSRAKSYLNMFIILVTILSSMIIYPIKCADILLVSNCLSHSHSLWYNKLAGLLVNSGHQVVLLDTDPLRTKSGNITHFLMEGAYDYSDMNLTLDTMREMFENPFESNIINLEMYFWYCQTCRKILKSPGVKDLMRTYYGKKFDLIIMDYQCDSFLGLVPYFGNPPFIIATAFADPENVLHKVGLYDNPSYVPARLFSSFSVEMNFVERTINTFYNLYLFYKLKLQYIPFEEESAKQIFGPNSPSIEAVGQNVSLVMVNTHFALTGAKPLPPAVIPVFGFHIDPVKPLPQDIKTFLDNAKDGAILFSFGTNIPSEVLSPEKINIFLNVFSLIQQKVIWKFNSSLIDKVPKNILISEWLPQTDVLAHKNIVAFISHGGLLGTQEAMYFGVPVIGFPFFIDQISNVERVVNKGLGVKVSFKSLSAEILLQAIRNVTQNKRERVNELSKVLYDNPLSPREVAVYWIEYVLRNKDHLSYIQSQSAKLPTYQILLLDVLVAFLTTIICVLIMSWFITKSLCRILTCNKSSKRKEKEN